MSKVFFTQQGRALLLAAVVAVFTSGAWAQDGLVPFLVNVDATVKAETRKGCMGLVTRQISVTANQVNTIRLYLGDCLGVRYGEPKQTNVPAIVSNLGGKVTVNLPTQSYKNAEIALYTVNGKQILRNKVPASSAVNSVSHPNVAKGVYLLSVNGTNDVTVTSRLTHGGGWLNINVVFGNGSENRFAGSQMSKKTDIYEDWKITVSSTIAGYIDSVYTLRVVDRTNALQNIALREKSPVDGGESNEPVVIGDKKWMKKNLNIETADSWCYENSNDSCAKYGRLYTLAAAKMACSTGWHLPSRVEWESLGAAAGGLLVGKKLKSTGGWNNNGNGTDDFGFSALPGGYRLNEQFSNAGYYGYWWMDTGDDGEDAGFSMRYDDDYLHETIFISKGMMSVRCVKDGS